MRNVKNVLRKIIEIHTIIQQDTLKSYNKLRLKSLEQKINSPTKQNRKPKKKSYVYDFNI